MATVASDSKEGAVQYNGGEDDIDLFAAVRFVMANKLIILWGVVLGALAGIVVGVFNAPSHHGARVALVMDAASFPAIKDNKKIAEELNQVFQRPNIVENIAQKFGTAGTSGFTIKATPGESDLDLVLDIAVPRTLNITYQQLSDRVVSAVNMAVEAFNKDVEYRHTAAAESALQSVKNHFKTAQNEFQKEREQQYKDEFGIRSSLINVELMLTSLGRKSSAASSMGLLVEPANRNPKLSLSSSLVDLDSMGAAEMQLENTAGRLQKLAAVLLKEGLLSQPQFEKANSELQNVLSRQARAGSSRSLSEVKLRASYDQYMQQLKASGLPPLRDQTMLPTFEMAKTHTNGVVQPPSAVFAMVKTVVGFMAFGLAVSLIWAAAVRFSVERELRHSSP